MLDPATISGAVEALAGAAKSSSKPMGITPRQNKSRATARGRGEASALPSTNSSAPPLSIIPESGEASRPPSTRTKVPPRTPEIPGVHTSTANLSNFDAGNPIPSRPKSACTPDPLCRDGTSFASGHNLRGTQEPGAASEPLAVTGQLMTATHLVRASDGNLPLIVEQWRRRQDMLRARQRLELQAQSVCRRFVDGDKTAAAKLWGEVKANPAHDLRGWLNPYLFAMVPLDATKAEVEKSLAKLAKQLPVYPWARDILGLGEVSLAAIIGECGIGPGEYKSVSALWKRMGLAVIDGGRQRRVTGAVALDHGYNAERRSLMWNVGASLIKAQLRSEKGEDGKKVAGSEYSLGELGQVYLDRKAYLNARETAKDEPWTKAHIHNDAMRYMEKRLLRQLWQVWRGATASLTTVVETPPAELAIAA